MNSKNLKSVEFDKNIMKGRVLTIDTGSLTTKIGYFIDGKKIFAEKLVHSAEDLAAYRDIMEQENMRQNAVSTFLGQKGIMPDEIDIIMARGGLFEPAITGIYIVNDDMRDVLLSCRESTHACNLSAIISDNLSKQINHYRQQEGIEAKYGDCHAYIADPPMADEMIPECRLGGIPEFPHRVIFHSLNSRATVKQYLRDNGHKYNDITAIVAHIGGGITISLHRNGKVIDTNDGVGGDGPFTPERAGSCPAFPLVDMCFSGDYTKEEVKRKLIGKGGAVAYFGTNDIKTLIERAKEGDEKCAIFMNALCLNIAKYIAAEASVVEGKVDVILMTGGGSFNEFIINEVKKRVGWIAPIVVYPGETELESLAESGYTVLNGEPEILKFDKKVKETTEFDLFKK